MKLSVFPLAPGALQYLLGSDRTGQVSSRASF